MSDIRALLLTDVVDSTKLSEQLGDQAMAEVWAAHDRVARDLLSTCNGREIDKTDGMLVLFHSAVEALHYATRYHQALADLPTPLFARAGLHVGPVILRENPADDVARGAKPLEVDGLAKPVAARVMSVAGSGQTLVTRSAREAIDDAWLSRSGLDSRSHGHWVLKGVTDPLELFQVGANTAPFNPPADGDKVFRVVRVGDRWLPVRQVANNLPEQLTSFIGRERELADIKQMLDKTRLLTLLGMGGLGKTRLSQRVASEMLAEFSDGVWFIDLAPLRDPTLVVSETAQILGVREEPGRPLLHTLCAHLKPLRCLFIIDNCEHLLGACAVMANALLKSGPGLALLATSREALGVPGERTYPILPLPVPDRSAAFDDLARSTAVRLFVDRAQAHRLNYELTPVEAPAVAELVARLEGIPLALELAAARIRSLGVVDINRRLKNRYKVLTDGSRMLEERQQTLRALVDWSYDMLNLAEQTVLQRLSVFAGGFDLPAAEAVCSDEAIDADDVLDLLSSLVQKSLVSIDTRDGGARYRMLETIRDYAAEKLGDADAVTDTASRHCLHYFGLAKEANRGLKGPERARWVSRLETEHDNLRAASHAAQSGAVDPFIAVKMAVALLGFWLHDGYTTEGRAVVRAALDMHDIQASPLAHSHALYVAATLATGQSDHAEARKMLTHCLALRRGLGHPVDIAATLSTLSLSLIQAGEIEQARAAETEALALFQQLGDQFGEAIGLMHLGQIEFHGGNDSQADAHFAQALLLARQIQHLAVEGELVLMQGMVALQRDDLASARQHFIQAQEVCSKAADKRGETAARWWLGRAELEMGDFAAAREHLNAVLPALRSFEMREELLACVEDHGLLAAALGQWVLAAQLAASTALLRQQLKLGRTPRSDQHWQDHLAAMQAALDEPTLTAALQMGQSWAVDEAIAAALRLSVVRLASESIALRA